MEWDEIYKRLEHDMNDPTAWSALERRVKTWARRDFSRAGQHIVDDATADTCAAIALRLVGARGAETFAGFAYGHYLNTRRNIRRGSAVNLQPIGTQDFAAPEADDGPDPDALARLQREIAALPQRERVAVTMRYFEDCNSERIAAALGVTSGNARRILFNGLSRLRTNLGVRERTKVSARIAAAVLS
jgi:RNA polymerase sigma factor (sigma-70 family)